MNDNELKDFLKKNLSPAPSSPLGEGSAIWAKMQVQPKRKNLWMWAFVPLMAASLAVVISIKHAAPVSPVEDDFFYQEWSEFARDVDSDMDIDMAGIGR